MSRLKKFSSAVGGLALICSGFAYVAAAGATTAGAATGPFAYTALSSPNRICDTRPASESGTTGACTGKTLGAGSTLTVDVPGLPTGAAAVEVNVAVTNTAGQGFITVFPTGGTNSGTSNINYTKGQTASNLVTVGVGTDSSNGDPAISIFNGPSGGTGGNADVVVDLEGYYSLPGSSTAGEYFAIAPSRIADSRCGQTPNGLGADCSAESLPSANTSFKTLGAGTTESIQAAGVGTVPSTSVADVVLGVTVTNATAGSYLSTFEAGTSPGLFSNVNFAAGQTVASKVIVPVSSSGMVSFFNHAGNADVVVDVEGYFAGAGSTASGGSLFTPLASPSRVLSQTTVAAGASQNISVAGTGSVPSGATAGAFNLTDVSPTDGNFLTGYPTGGATPSTSDVNWVPADPYNVVADAAFGTLSTSGSYSVLNGPADTKNNAGPTGVIVDLFGYFTAVTPTTGDVLSALTASPNSLVAGTTNTSTVTATVTSKSTANPVAGDTVNLTVTGTGCGTLSPTSGTTNASGQVTSTFTVGATAATCTITAIETNSGTSDTTTISQTAPPRLVTLIASPASIPANGTATSAITATVTQNGVPVPTDAVEYSLVASVPGACNFASDLVHTTPSPSTNNPPIDFGVTGAAGTNVFRGAGNTNIYGAAEGGGVFRAGTTPGTCTITATEAGDGQSATAVVTLTPTKDTLKVAPSSPSAQAGTGKVIQVSATDTLGTTPVAGVTVLFTAITPPGGNCGTLSPTFNITNSSGIATVNYTVGATSGFCVITATEVVGGTGSSSGPAIIDQTNPLSTATSITLNASPSSIPGNGSYSPLAPGSVISILTADVTTSGNTGVNGDRVVFTYSPSAPGVCFLTTDIPNAGLNGSPKADAWAPDVFTATALTGDAMLGFDAGPVAGTCTITATEAESGLSVSTTVTITPVVNTVAVTANPVSIVGNGTSTSTVTATVTSPTGSPVPNDSVHFTLTGEPAGSCGSISPATATTGASGTLSATYISASVPASSFCLITAKEANTGSSGNVAIDETQP